MSSSKKLSNDERLAKELTELTKQVRHLKDLDFLQALNRPGRLMWLSFLKGVFVGFGTVLGASFLVGFFVYLVGKISLVPYLGDFIQDVLGELDRGHVIEQQQEETITP